MERIIIHSDLNNFYASVEKKLRPELVGKPVAVCGSKEERRGIVLAKSEEAKKNKGFFGKMKEAVEDLFEEE